MIYIRTWLLFIRVLGSYYLHPNRTDKFSLSGKKLISLSYRLSNKDNKNFLSFTSAFAHSILAKKIKPDEPCRIYSQGGKFFYDSHFTRQEEEKRLSHIKYFMKDNIAGSIWKNKLLGYFTPTDKILQIIFEFLLAIFLLPIALFEKYKGAVGLIFWEYIELVNLLKILKSNRAHTLYYYSIYEKDSNISSIAIQKLGIKVNKITSLTPIRFWNNIIVATDTLILCDSFQLEEVDVFKDTIHAKNVELWGPENIAEAAIFYNTIEKRDAIRNMIGFYSSAAYQRTEQGHLDEWNFEKNENTVMSYLAEYLKANKGIKLIVFPHPREKKAENRDAMKMHYNAFFEGLNYSIYEDSSFSFASFDKATLGVSMYSSVIYERLYYGYKCLMMPFGKDGLGIEYTSIQNICASDKTDFFSKIDQYLQFTEDQYFEKVGLPKSLFMLNKRKNNKDLQVSNFHPGVKLNFKSSKIAIVNYGLGNPSSIQNMLRRLGNDSIITADLSAIEKADKIILPGVGSFKTGMKNLKEQGLIDLLNHKALFEKVPVLGICLGMQLLTSHSEEGDADGLAWIPGQTKKFIFNNETKLPIPHMGWTEINFETKHPLFKDIPPNPRYYFAHSYYISSDNPYSIANAHYGSPFACALAKNNIMGVQFHPEKSHHFGLAILNNFVFNL